MSASLHLLPMPLFEGHSDVPEQTLEAFKSTTTFICERARTLRRFLSSIGHPQPIDTLKIFEMDKHDPQAIVGQLSAILKDGKVGLCSEAGCPCIADPGFRVVQWAQKRGITVIPYPGPSSILMALMSSGFSGQSFAFHGYLSAKKPQLQKDLANLEARSLRDKSPQIFIEAPYRNKQVLETAQVTLKPSTRLHIAVDLSSPEAMTITKTIGDWKKGSLPDVHKKPAVFVLLG